MAVYKVPQDVEAEDKLLGPFSFRQFIYLLIVAAAVGIGWALSQIFIGLAIIPAPIVIFFGALALPLKKDQPMEVYLGALISFHFLKPKKRLWKPDGIDSLITITAPKKIEIDRTKHLSQKEAQERLGYLTDIVDSRGWAVRGTGVPTEGVSSMNETYRNEANSANDMLDDDNSTAQKFDALIEQKQTQHMQSVANNLRNYQPKPIEQSQQYNSQPQQIKNISNTQSQTGQKINPFANEYKPYQNTESYSTYAQEKTPLHEQPPTIESKQEPITLKQSDHQKQPNSTQLNAINEPHNKNIPEKNIKKIDDNSKYIHKNTSIKPPSPDIIKLANESDDLTVADVARQANRIAERERKHHMLDEEVSISLH